MSLSIGIIGLPNVGKSTLFNALLKRQVALAANYPFATIEPNVGVVDVPDSRLQQLAEVVKKENGARIDKEIPEKVVPAVIKFHDIAGLVRGAHKGEGLGNQFLSHIREVNAIVHVVRAFDDENVLRADSTNPKDDYEIIRTEIGLSDLQVLQGAVEKLSRDVKKNPKELSEKLEVAKKVFNHLKDSATLEGLGLTVEEKALIKEYNLLCLKPEIVVFNIEENKIGKEFTHTIISGLASSVALSAKVESELCSLSIEDQQLYMKELGIEQSGLDLVIRAGYELLGLQTFFTAGPKEVRAWTIKRGDRAPQAAGTIHTDFERGFISAEIVDIKDFVSLGGWKKAKDGGFVRLEGKQYVMCDGDVVLFRFNV